MSKNVFCTHAYLEHWWIYKSKISIIMKYRVNPCSAGNELTYPFANRVDPDQRAA